MISDGELNSLVFYERGVGYLNRARKMYRSYNVVKPVLLYSILSMSIENICMFMLMNRNHLPYNHTMADLVESLEECGLMNQDIKEGMMRIEEVFNLCDLGVGRPAEPTMEEIFDFQCTAEKLLAVADADRPVARRTLVSA